MAFVPWKDRVTSTPHRYKLTEVSADTYDLEAVPGSISEAGIPVNAENLNKLIQRDGDDIKDTVVGFTEASSRENIGTGESAATLFGKIKKYFTDLKTHAFTTPSTTQGTGTTTVPSDNLLKESSFSAVYTSLSDSRLGGIGNNSTQVDIINAMSNNSVMLADFSNNVYKPSGLALCTIFVMKTSINRNTLCVYDKYTGRLYLGAVGTVGGVQSFSGWAQTIDDSTAQEISGVKTYSASPIVPTTPSGPSAAVAKSYVDTPTANTVMTKANPQYILKNTGMTVGTLPDADTYNSAIGWTDNEDNNCSYIQYAYRQSGAVTGKWVINSHNQPSVRETGVILEQTKGATAADDLHRFYPISNTDCDLGTSNNKWKDIHFAGALIKNGTEVFPSPYDKVIRTQAQFEALIASSTWLDAKSVALVGQFTLSTANNKGVKIPATVKQIHGYNGAKITITNFAYNSSTAKGGLWYDTLPTTLDYSIRDLEVDCTGTGEGVGFYNCTNLTNCIVTGTGTGNTGSGFAYCTNLTNCTGAGAGNAGYGFYNCDYLTNCTGTGTGAGEISGRDGFGFYDCENLTNCTGTGTGTDGWGFYNIIYASNCRRGGSSTTAMWGGTNKNIDIDTCRKTPVAVTSDELTTLNE